MGSVRRVAEDSADRAPSKEETCLTISREIAAIHSKGYGVEVEKQQTHVLDDTVLTVLDVTLTPAERTLVERGRGDAVQLMRHEFQEAVGANFKAVVERATGRRVVAFSSHTNLDPPFVSELFRLGPSTAQPQEPD